MSELAVRGQNYQKGGPAPPFFMPFFHIFTRIPGKKALFRMIPTAIFGGYSQQNQ
jgi:hypothetical protein